MSMEVVFPGGKRVDALYKGFRIQTDQSKKDGGDESAPAPFQLFLASIATCAGIYALSFCTERNIPTDKLRLTMRTDYDRNKKMIGKIHLDIYVPEDFPEKYHTALIKAVDLCAVKRHMDDSPEFETIIKFR